VRSTPGECRQCPFDESAADAAAMSGRRHREVQNFTLVRGILRDHVTGDAFWRGRDEKHDL